LFHRCDVRFQCGDRCDVFFHIPVDCIYLCSDWWPLHTSEGWCSGNACLLCLLIDGCRCQQ
jgi:hypothetical protein